MRGQVIATSLAVLVAASSVGCKTTPNMAWWKTSKKDAPEAEVLAHSAPELPSEIAKEVEGVAAASTEQISGGQAAPFVPGIGTPAVANVAAAPAAYPSTEAPKFTPATQTAAVPAAPASADLGSVNMPYNPNAVPPAAPSTPAAIPADIDRYASTPTPSGTLDTPASYPSAAPATQPGIPATPTADSRYAASVPSAPSSQDAVTAPITTSPEVQASLGDRYAQATTPVVSSETVTENLQSPVTPTPQTETTVAEASAYRPGGTSSYPTTMDAAVQVATRPAAPVESVPSTSTTPAVSGGSLPATPAVPQVPRYR